MFSSTSNNVMSLYSHFSFSSRNPNTHETINNNNNNDHHNNNIFFYNHNNQLIPLTIPFLPTSNFNYSSNNNNNNHLPSITEFPGFNNIQAPSNQNALNDNAVNYEQAKVPVKKKDRHSKICTSQGLRDRRVRLSIEIARKFFDLQDLLGFDRASKTLEWLLVKSKKAIKELSAKNGIITETNYNRQSLSSSNLTSDQIDQGHVVSKRVSLNCVDYSEMRPKKLQKNSGLVKESRAKARARARERTRVKMSARAIHDQTTLPCPVSTLIPVLNHSRSADPKITGSRDQVEEENQVHKQEGASEESILGIERKLKSNSCVGHYQQNLVQCYNNNHSPNISQNWENIISNSISRSSFWPITNKNVSTAGPQLQVYGKPWEDHENN